MDLIDWSLSALDKILSSRIAALEVAACLGNGCWPGAYETIGTTTYFIFGFLDSGFLLIGSGVAFAYRNIMMTGNSPNCLTTKEVCGFEWKEDMDSKRTRERETGIKSRPENFGLFGKMGDSLKQTEDHYRRPEAIGLLI